MIPLNTLSVSGCMESENGNVRSHAAVDRIGIVFTKPEIGKEQETNICRSIVKRRFRTMRRINSKVTVSVWRYFQSLFTNAGLEPPLSIKIAQRN